MKIDCRIVNGVLIPIDDKQTEKLNGLDKAATYVIDLGKSSQRTIRQNSLIHAFCRNISDELERQNIKLDKVIKHNTPLSMLAVKELIFKSVVLSLYGKDSTTKLNKDELNLVFDTVIRALALKGVDTANLLREEY